MDRHLFDILWKSTATSTARSRSRSSPPTVRPPPTPCSAPFVGRGAIQPAHARHAMDFFIPDVRWSRFVSPGCAAARRRRLLPDLGSPFVHLDTGSIRHWPRMTHDQLARVFPTPHRACPLDGTPLKATSSPAPISKSAATTPRLSANGPVRRLVPGQIERRRG